MQSSTKGRKEETKETKENRTASAISSRLKRIENVFFGLGISCQTRGKIQHKLVSVEAILIVLDDSHLKAESIWVDSESCLPAFGRL